jgi:dimethylargininase
MKIALTREVSPSIVRCELTHLDREAVNLARARAQHERYCDTLAELGCEVRRLPAEPDLPDAVFVEDAVVVLDDVAVLTRPGAVSRRAEVPTLAEALRPYRRLAGIEPPGTLDGGDVLRVGKTLYVGQSRRTGARAIEQLREIVSPHGYSVLPVVVDGCLHLKSAVTQVADDFLLLNALWVDPDTFPGMRRVEVDPAEPFGANALRVENAVVHAAAFPRTRRRLEACGIRVIALDASELAKAEGGLTCCSVIFET